MNKLALRRRYHRAITVVLKQEADSLFSRGKLKVQHVWIGVPFIVVKFILAWLFVVFIILWRVCVSCEACGNLNVLSTVLSGHETCNFYRLATCFVWFASILVGLNCICQCHIDVCLTNMLNVSQNWCMNKRCSYAQLVYDARYLHLYTCQRHKDYDKMRSSVDFKRSRVGFASYVMLYSLILISHRAAF